MERDPSPEDAKQKQPEPQPTTHGLWYREDAQAVLHRFRSSADGIDDRQAEERLQRFGPNRVGEHRSVSAWRVLLDQFTSPLIYVLLGALLATLFTSYATGESRWGDAIVIGLVLVVNSTVGFFQEYRAEHAVEALMQLIAPKALVRRSAETKSVKADSLVPGDVVELTEGDIIPADLRLFEVRSLQVNEAALTGESVPVNKITAAMAGADDTLPASDQTNMGFMGTAVTSGSGAGVIVATGQATRIGRIAQQVREAGTTRTPLERRIQQLAVWITWGILIIAVLASAVGLLMGRDWAQMVTLAVALAVAAIPAGLPIVVTVALAIGVRRMAERHAVIRHLPAVDTLGSCTAIISDKTGTLTQNRMTVRAIEAGGQRYDAADNAEDRGGCLEHEGEPVELDEHPALREALLAGMLCNNADVPEAEGDEPSGDPMEVALVIAGRKAGLRRRSLKERYPRTDEVPFQTERRFMATIHDDAGDADRQAQGPLVFIKGAPEAILELCTNARTADGGTGELDRAAVMQRSDALAGEGLRVLAMASGRGGQAASDIKQDEPPQHFTFMGLQGMLDPPRPSAVEAIDDCHHAGIRVIMVTGDHARTAAAIAHDVHLDRHPRSRPPRAQKSARPGTDAANDVDLPEAHTGQEVESLSDEQFDRVLERVNVFARVEPIQKTRIVERLKARQQIVAVTGDGVNDAPALKAAHIGAAMGSGTDVAKEASDMVLTDDNFASVYHAVEQGRAAFRNIRMATFFLLSTGAAMVLLTLSALGLGWPLPLLPAQILWCNVVTNGIADVALAFEPGEKALYRRPPRPPSEGILDRILIERLVLIGVWLALGTLGVFLWKWGFDFSTWEAGSEENLTGARTAALTTMVLFQKVHVFNCRSEDVSIFRKSLFLNKVLLIGVLTSLAVHVAAVYLPSLQHLLTLTGLDLTTWLLATAVASSAIIVNEVHKWLRPDGTERQLRLEGARERPGQL